MSTFKERLEQESKELSEKLTKLEGFINSEGWNTVDKNQRALLFIQVKAMETYSEVLEMRIIDLDRITPKANATLTDQDLIDNPHFKDAGFQQGDSVIISEENGKIQATGVN